MAAGDDRAQAEEFDFAALWSLWQQLFGGSPPARLLDAADLGSDGGWLPAELFATAEESVPEESVTSAAQAGQVAAAADAAAATDPTAAAAAPAHFPVIAGRDEAPGQLLARIRAYFDPLGEKTAGTEDADVLVGTQGNDVLTGLGGRDVLFGGAGSDTFVVDSVSHSTGAGHDLLVAFGAGDRIDLAGTISAIAETVRDGALSRGSFDSNLAAAIGAGALGAGEAVLFAPDEGDLAGKLFLVADGNGKAGYQAGEDYVWQLVGAPGADVVITPDIFI